MEFLYVALILIFCVAAKWFLMRPVGTFSFDLNSIAVDLVTKTQQQPANADLFETRVISRFEEVDYSDFDVPTFSRRNVSIFTLDDAALWFETKIISIFEEIDYSEYESPTGERRKIAAAKLRKEKAAAAKLRKSIESTTDVSITSSSPRTRKIAAEYIQCQPLIA
ncbi:MAG: hypothetical protein EOO52_12765 [Gammaproteobacteria bacterium]|nr:MAG: hypothetical protein EOO52_12765 [Gammaproteobacteria bacterium]